MILASVPLCAAMVACGSGGSEADGPTQVSANQLLEGISLELSEAHITVLDSDPDEEPELSLQDASEILDDHGATVTRGALLRMDSYTDIQGLAPETYPEVLAWALEVDLTSYDGEGIFAPESSMAVVFLGANDGSFVSMYER